MLFTTIVLVLTRKKQIIELVLQLEVWLVGKSEQRALGTIRTLQIKARM